MAREMMINDGSNTQPYHVLRHGNSLSARYMDVVSMGDTLPCKWWNSARTAEMHLKTMALLVPLLYTVKPGKVLGFRLTLRFSISSFQQIEEWYRILMMYIEKVMRASQTVQNLCLILGCERAITSTQLGFLNSARCTQQFSHQASNFHLSAVWCDNLGNQSMYHLWTGLIFEICATTTTICTRSTSCCLPGSSWAIAHACLPVNKSVVKDTVWNRLYLGLTKE